MTIELLEKLESEMKEEILKEQGHNRFDDFDDFTKGRIVGVGMLLHKYKQVEGKV